MNHEYPQFRKLSNGKSYYRINSPELMTEIQASGVRFSIYEIQARILPERLLISDILTNKDGNFINISSIEFDAFLEDCKTNLRQF